MIISTSQQTDIPVPVDPAVLEDRAVPLDPAVPQDPAVALDPAVQQDPLGQHAAATPAGYPLGRRVAAALVDIALLSGLFVIMSLIVGQTSQAVGPAGIAMNIFSFTRNGQTVASLGLDGLWVVLYLALLPVYYFAMEALGGQTVGKRLLGLRVQRPDGGRPSVAAIAWRTLFRPIDSLPVAYLAGFITMLATGSRRQRLGDLAARTVVARALPARHRGLAVIPLAIVLAAAVGLSVYRVTTGPAPGTYQANGVSFDYPPAWQQGHLPVDVSFGQVRGTEWTTAVVLDQADWIDVAAYRTPFAIPAGLLRLLPPSAKAAFRRAVERAGGQLLAGPQEITLAGVPGLLIRTAGTQGGIPVENTFAFTFIGTTEYVVLCQQAQGQGAANVRRACDQVIRTFAASS